MATVIVLYLSFSASSICTLLYVIQILTSDPCYRLHFYLFIYCPHEPFAHAWVERERFEGKGKFILLSPTGMKESGRYDFNISSQRINTYCGPEML